MGPTRQGAHLGGRVRPPPLWPTGACLVPEIIKYSIKNHTKFSGHLENFYFRDISYCTDNSENRQKILFLLYSIKLQK